MKTTKQSNPLAIILATAAVSSCGFDLSKLQQDAQQGQSVTAQWQSPANYTRTPSDINPVNPIKLAVDFSDQSGCPNETYRFWLFSKDGGTPLRGLGINAKLPPTNHFEQTVNFPVNTPVYQIRLSCTKADGERYTDGDILESGSPAFTPRVAISWKNPENYTRTPAGAHPSNPVTLSVKFTDESGCPYQTYQFWAYALNGTPIGPLGSVRTLVQGSALSTTVALPLEVPVYAVRLACVDTEGLQYDYTSNLEVGNPAFTPTSSSEDAGIIPEEDAGTIPVAHCTGQNISSCVSITNSAECSVCGGTWEFPTGTCTGEATANGEQQCQTATNQSACESLSSTDGWGLPIFSPSVCMWDGSACHVKSTVCTDRPTHMQCAVQTPLSYDYGDCAWSPVGTNFCSNGPGITGCFGDVTHGCNSWPTQEACEQQPLAQVTGIEGFSHLCIWDAENNVCTNGNCSDLTETQCSSAYSSTQHLRCYWGEHAMCCNNSLNCQSPQSSAECAACGGTWTE